MRNLNSATKLKKQIQLFFFLVCNLKIGCSQENGENQPRKCFLAKEKETWTDWVSANRSKPDSAGNWISIKQPRALIRAFIVYRLHRFLSLLSGSFSNPISRLKISFTIKFYIKKTFKRRVWISFAFWRVQSLTFFSVITTSPPRVTLPDPAESTSCFPCKRFTTCCNEMYESSAGSDLETLEIDLRWGGGGHPDP